jgi:hypothetical protein
MATQTLEIICAHAELNGRNDRWCWNGTKTIVGHTQYVDHHSNTRRLAIHRPGAPPQVTLTSACLIARVSRIGLFVTPCAQAASRTTQEQNGCQRRLTVFTYTVDHSLNGIRHRLLNRA